MRVSIDEGAEFDCNQLKVTCSITASGCIPLKRNSPEANYGGKQLFLIVDQVREPIADDNIVSLKMKNHDGTVISHEVHLTRLFDLVRDNVDEHGSFYDDDDNLDNDDW